MRNHAQTHAGHPSRRDFFHTLMRGALAGASILELAHYRAAWARSLASTASTPLFDIKKVADGVFLAQARAQSQINSNSAIFVNSADVLVVDAHSKPSAAASLIAQIKKEITPKPVRYVVNSHFHWDHIQGNHAYRATGGKIDFIASEPTRQLMVDLAQQRLKESLDAGPNQIDVLRSRAGKSSSSAEKAFCEDQIRQVQAYMTEMKSFTLELPTVTFSKLHVIKDKAHELQIEFHGHAHTAGDVVVFCPQKRVAATGDMIHGMLPFIADAFPKSWPKTIDAVGKLGFDQILPGHGPVHQNRVPMTGMRNYIEELAEKVDAGRKAGKSIAELQKANTVASLKSLQSNGYAKFVVDNQAVALPNFGPQAPLQEGVKVNIVEVYKNLDRV